ncbi:MAG: hypothetical protein M1820_000188 [Bogoriella megaspora]|nr:MAG: hypothetical protein M1820_000188 [Bogoriella megaspora]
MPTNLSDVVLNDPTISNRHLRIHCVVYEESEDAEIPPLIYVHDISSNGCRIKPTTSRGNTIDSLRMLGKAAGATLISDGDEIFLSPSLYFKLLLRPTFDRPPESPDPIADQEKLLISPHYHITDRKLGEGGHGCVYVAIHRTSSKQLACKYVDLRVRGRGGLRPNSTSELDETRLAKERNALIKFREKQTREYLVLKDLDHPNVVRLEKVFYSSSSLYIFQELITGGDLYSYIDFRGGRLGDAEAGLIIRQVLEGIAYLHGKNIAHRDLKVKPSCHGFERTNTEQPDNILMTSLTPGSRVILTDFGHARYLPGGSENSSNKQRMFSVVGTFEYVAPEVYRQNKEVDPESGYSKAIDLWSIGTITASMLTGDTLFTNRFDPEYIRNPKKVIIGLAAQCNLDELDSSIQWRRVGHRVKDFVRKLLVLDEGKRLTAKQALQHRWFTNRKHRQSFDSIYQKSIKDWYAQDHAPNIIENLDDTALQEHENPITTPPHQYNHSATSRYFKAPTLCSTLPDISTSSALSSIPETEYGTIILSGNDNGARRSYNQMMTDTNRSLNDPSISVQTRRSQQEQTVVPDASIAACDVELSSRPSFLSSKSMSARPTEARSPVPPSLEPMEETQLMFGAVPEAHLDVPSLHSLQSGLPVPPEMTTQSLKRLFSFVHTDSNEANGFAEVSQRYGDKLISAKQLSDTPSSRKKSRLK